MNPIIFKLKRYDDDLMKQMDESGLFIYLDRSRIDNHPIYRVKDENLQLMSYIMDSDAFDRLIKISKITNTEIKNLNIKLMIFNMKDNIELIGTLEDQISGFYIPNPTKTSYLVPNKI